MTGLIRFSLSSVLIIFGIFVRNSDVSYSLPSFSVVRRVWKCFIGASLIWPNPLHNCRLDVVISAMWFRVRRALYCLWNYVVFLSPTLSHNLPDFKCQYSSSLLKEQCVFLCADIFLFQIKLHFFQLGDSVFPLDGGSFHRFLYPFF